MEVSQLSEILNVQFIQQKLIDEKNRLQASITARLNVESEGRNPDRADLAQAYTSRERETALLAMERAQLKQVENALQRLEEGDYGNCNQCGEAIPPARLEILPHATLCVRCQAQQE
jgi:DnaK suppressor protein